MTHAFTSLRRAAPRPLARATSAVAALAAGALLAGCGALPDKPQRATLYDFGPPPLEAPAPSTAAPLPPLQLPDVEANARLDGSQLLYRLGYADANELRPYAQARWALPPARLFEQRLHDTLALQRVVLNPQEGGTISRAPGQVPNTLRVTLEEFTHYFESPTRSIGLVRVSATLLQTTPGGDRVLGQRSFTARQNAPTPDAAGGVKALAAASDDVVAQLARWVDQPKR